MLLVVQGRVNWSMIVTLTMATLHWYIITRSRWFRSTWSSSSSSLFHVIIIIIIVIIFFITFSVQRYKEGLKLLTLCLGLHGNTCLSVILHTYIIILIDRVFVLWFIILSSLCCRKDHIPFHKTRWSIRSNMLTDLCWTSNSIYCYYWCVKIRLFTFITIITINIYSIYIIICLLTFILRIKKLM